MKDLIFASTTNREGSLEKVWSGTVNGLYQALGKIYKLDHVNIGPWNHGLMTFPLGFVKTCDKYCGGDNMGLLQEKVFRNFFHVNDKVPVLQFDETIWNKKNTKQYIYLDLTVNYVRRMREKHIDSFSYQHLKNNKIKRREIYQNKFFKHAAGIFTMGKWLEDDIINAGLAPKEKVHHVGGGCSVNIKLLDDNVEKNGKRLLFVGKDFERKNGNLVLEAFRILKSKRKDVELYIAGGENKGIDIEGVTFLGLLDYDELAKWYNRCDVFVLPSIFEAYGLVFVEALCFGLPCIGRDAFEMPYFIDENKTGLLLRGGAEELADLMERSLASQEMKENVRNKRNWYLKEYSWDTVAKRISKVIDAGIY